MRTLEYLAVSAVALAMAWFVATAAVSGIAASIDRWAALIERVDDAPR